MIRAGAGCSNNSVSEKAAEEAARRALTKAGISHANTCLVFATTEHRPHYERMLKKIRDVTGARNVVGASGYGVLTDESEIECQPGLSVMALDSNDVNFGSFLVSNLQEDNFRAGENVGMHLKNQVEAPSLLLLFPDPFSLQSNLFFDGFEQAYGYVPMVGALSSEDGQEEKTYQLHNGRAAYDSISALTMSGAMRFEVGITRSCRPFGEPIRITRAEGNIIYEMDGRPAYDILLESMSEIDFKNPDQILQRVFLGLPLKSFQTDFSESHYLIRNIMGVNAKKGLLTCITPVEEGDFVTFAVRDASLARQDFIATLKDLKQRMQPSQASFGLYFNCCARGQALYGKPDEDIKLIHHYFPGMPLAGFFAYGEIAPVDHINILHHHTGVLMLVAENPA